MWYHGQKVTLKARLQLHPINVGKIWRRFLKEKPIQFSFRDKSKLDRRSKKTFRHYQSVILCFKICGCLCGLQWEYEKFCLFETKIQIRIESKLSFSLTIFFHSFLLLFHIIFSLLYSIWIINQVENDIMTFCIAQKSFGLNWQNWEIFFVPK